MYPMVIILTIAAKLEFMQLVMYDVIADLDS